jgi:ribosomal protein S18 acetylase RimI-like enzyme
MIALRRARLADAPGIAAVHVATWRSTYAAILPQDYLASLSVYRLARQYEHLIRLGFGVHVAITYNAPGEPPVLGFATAGRGREPHLGEGEVEMLYVLDDYRDHGLGGQLLRLSAKHLAQMGCRSAYAWVLRDNPSRYFYQRLGGKCVAASTTQVAGAEIPQTAYAWDPLATLLDVTA